MAQPSDIGRRVRPRAPFGAAFAVSILLLGYGADVPAQAANTWIAFSTARDGERDLRHAPRRNRLAQPDPERGR